MNIKMRFKVMQAKELATKAHKEAQKLALAAIIMQFVLAGAWLAAEKSGVIELLEPKTTTLYVARGSEVPLEEQKTAEIKEVVEVSAYTSEVAQTDSSPYITADGTNLKKEYKCIIATNDYPFNTRIEIETLGICEVHDRMNKRYTGKSKIDVYMGNDKQRALEFGRKELGYKVL